MGGYLPPFQCITPLHRFPMCSMCIVLWAQTRAPPLMRSAEAHGHRRGWCIIYGTQRCAVRPFCRSGALALGLGAAARRACPGPVMGCLGPCRSSDCGYSDLPLGEAQQPAKPQCVWGAGGAVLIQRLSPLFSPFTENGPDKLPSGLLPTANHRRSIATCHQLLGSSLLIKHLLRVRVRMPSLYRDTLQMVCSQAI